VDALDHPVSRQVLLAGQPSPDPSPAAATQAVIYARVSSTEQEREGFSIPAQLRLLREYAAKHELVVDREFVDVETAKQAGRTQFGNMLDHLAETPGLRTILVEKTDRLYRNFRDYVTIDDLDLEIHLVKESEIVSRGSRSHQKFIHGIKVLMAKNYIDNLSEETRKGMAEKVAKGGFPHFAPVGYKNDKATRTIVVDPERAPYVQRIFQWYATGEFSIEDLHGRCVEDGLIAQGRTRAIAKSKVEYLLKNPFYIGRIRWAGKLSPGAHEPIVSQELFDRVQERFTSFGRQRGKYRVHDFAFGTLLTCGECGYALSASRVKKRYVYYKCTNLKSCPAGYHREQDLEPMFREIVHGVALAPAVVEWVKSALRSSLADETAFYEESVRALTMELETVRRRMKSAYLDKVDGKITDDFWAECSSEWLSVQSRLKGRLNRHRKADTGYIEQGVTLLSLAERVEDMYASREDPKERQRLLATILESCTIKDGVLIPTYRPLWHTVAKMAAEKQPPPTSLKARGRPSSRITRWGG